MNFEILLVRLKTALKSTTIISFYCVSGDSFCVEDVKFGQWMFTDGKSWIIDSGLFVRCLDEPLESEPEPEAGIMISKVFGPEEVAKNTNDDDVQVAIVVIALSVGFVLILMGILVFIIMKRRRSSETNEGKPGEYADYYDKVEYKSKEDSTDVYDQAYQ